MRGTGDLYFFVVFCRSSDSIELNYEVGLEKWEELDYYCLNVSLGDALIDFGRIPCTSFSSYEYAFFAILHAAYLMSGNLISPY